MGNHPITSEIEIIKTSISHDSTLLLLQLQPLNQWREKNPRRQPISKK